MSDVFQSVFGFKELSSYDETRAQLLELAEFRQYCSNPEAGGSSAGVDREECIFRFPNGQSISAGIFSFPSVNDLYRQVINLDVGSRTTRGMIRIVNVVGEARALHGTVPSGSILQAASQFNLLEFPSPRTTPEKGISGYQYDQTQGPACAMAAAAGTAYRNYLVPVPFSFGKESPQRRGQTRYHQLNGLKDIEDYLLQQQISGLEQILPWTVRNGYIESSSPQLLESFNEALASNDRLEETLISLLRIGVQEDTTVTDDPEYRHTVTQTYNSAISIGYSTLPSSLWEPLARLVLKATYEATLLVGVLKTVQSRKLGNPALLPSSSASSPRAPPILLTEVGGGVFRNDHSWIIEAIERAVDRVGVHGVDLDIQIVHFGRISPRYRVLERDS